MASAVSVLTADQQLLELPSHVIHRLSQLLAPLAGWKRLMQVIEQPGNQSKLLFSAEHVDLVSAESRRSGRSETELVLDEWSTWGRRGERPCISHLVHALMTCGLLRAADYISESVLNQGRVPRQPQLVPGDLVEGNTLSTDVINNIVADRLADNNQPNISVGENRETGVSARLEADGSNRPYSDRHAEVRHEALAGGEGQSVTGGSLDTDQQSCLHFPYAYLCEVTANFGESLAVRDVESGAVEVGQCLGDGAFGRVFYANGGPEGELAVKQICNSAELAAMQFRTEVEILSSYRHENLLPLVGFSCDGDFNCVVYAYMSNGSLYDRLACKGDSAPLSGCVRVNVARDTAAALHYLHTHEHRPLIHRDIKSANILLDSNWQAKVGDFGLARQSVWNTSANGGSTVAVRTQLTGTVLGTSTYMAPEAFRGDISVKMDVFSFGVVLLEIVTGLPPFDVNRENRDLLSHVQDAVYPLEKHTASTLASCGIADTRAAFASSCIYTLLELAHDCTDSKRNRPHISKVLDSLVALCNDPNV